MGTRKRFLPFALAALLTVLATATTNAPTKAAPNGKTATSEVTAGLGLLYVISQYFVALAKSKGSVGQAEGIVNFNLAPAPTASPPPYAWSLRDFRDLIVYDVAAAKPMQDASAINAWRARFEHFRGCWNQILVLPASSGAANGTAPAKPCDAVSTDYKADLASKTLPFDLVDLTSSLADKSLYQQVLDQNVGSFATDNAVRSMFLAYIAQKLATDITKPPAPQAPGSPIDFSNLSTTFTKCLAIATVQTAFDCISSALTLQQALSAQRAQVDACRFSRGIWMPSFTAIVAKATKLPRIGQMIDPATSKPISAIAPIPYDPATSPASLRDVRVDFGAAPGC